MGFWERLLGKRQTPSEEARGLVNALRQTPLVACRIDSNDDEYLGKEPDRTELRRRVDAIVVLGQPAVPFLVEALQDRATHIRDSAIQALSQIGNFRGWESAIAAAAWEPIWAAAKTSGKARLIAVKMLECVTHRLVESDQFDHASQEKLVRGLSGNSSETELAAKILGQIGDAPSITALLEAVQDERCMAAVAVLEVLATLKDKRIAGVLIAMSPDFGRRGVYFREATLTALGQLGDVRAFETLVAALQERNYPIAQRAAAIALGKLKDGRARQPLKAALGATDPSVRQAVKDAIEMFERRSDPFIG